MNAPLLLLALFAAAPKPAAPAPRPYDAQHYRLEVRLSNDGSFENAVAITLSPSRALTEVQLDSFGLDIQKVTDAAGKDVPFALQEDAAQKSGTLTLKPKPALAAKKPVTFTIHYKGKAGTRQAGFFRSDPAGATDKSLPYFFTHLEAESARTFYPCNDRPDDKATFELFAIVDGRLQVLSNGVKAQDENFTSEGQNLRRVLWKQEQPMSTYLLALAVGQFEPVDVSVSVPASIWVLPGSKDRAFIATDATENHFAYEQRFVGVKYPWAKLDQVVLPHFIYGGMENTSITFERESALILPEKNYIHGRTRASGLIAHEMAHQWFGDYVTCKTWQDAWLNEGFATYLGQKAEDAYYDSDLIEVSRLRRTLDGYFKQEDGPRSRPLVARGITSGEAFDSVSYTKGAQILLMLERWVGEESFKKGIKAYLEKYAFGNATSEDFFDTFTRATGTEKELKGFRDSWLYKRGYPVVSVDAQWGGGSVALTIRQKPNHADESGTFVFKLPIVIHRADEPSYTKEETILVDKPVVTVRLDVPAAPQWVNWNKDQTALVKFDPSAIPEQAWAAAVRADPDPTWRALSAYNLLGTLVDPSAREQAKPSDAAMDAVQYLLAHDASPYVREAVLQWLADSQWKRLPEPLGPTLLTLAKKPEGLPEDALGRVRVRRAAYAALGKIDYKQGRDYLLQQGMSGEQDLNYTPAIALGVANIGDAAALGTLRSMVRNAKAKGDAWFNATAEALGAVTSPDVVPVLGDLVKDNPGNNELLTGVLGELDDNKVVKSSPEFAAFVQDFVVSNAEYSDEMKHRVMRLLDQVKTKDAKQALSTIAEKASSERIKASAQKVLARNFPEAAPPAPPAKGKKKK